MRALGQVQPHHRHPECRLSSTDSPPLPLQNQPQASIAFLSRPSCCGGVAVLVLLFNDKQHFPSSLNYATDAHEAGPSVPFPGVGWCRLEDHNLRCARPSALCPGLASVPSSVEWEGPGEGLKVIMASLRFRTALGSVRGEWGLRACCCSEWPAVEGWMHCLL